MNNHYPLLPLPPSLPPHTPTTCDKIVLSIYNDMWQCSIMTIVLLHLNILYPPTHHIHTHTLSQTLTHTHTHTHTLSLFLSHTHTLTHSLNVYFTHSYSCTHTHTHTHTHTVNLIDCLSSFTDLEKLQEAEWYYCPRCKKKQPSTKCLSLHNLPNVRLQSMGSTVLGNLNIHVEAFGGVYFVK